MKYAVKMASGAYIYTQSFTQIGSRIQKLKGGNSQTHRHRGSMEIASVYFRKVG
jgi:hypothetical protein